MTKEHGIAFDSATGEFSQCFDIGYDVVSKTTVPCAQQTWSQPLFQEGRYFNAISQELLFEERTQEFRHEISQP
ncbi:hypothetical protein F2Z80_14520 [Vibrio fortis]|uniref:Uncharacterized protein n=1 Tax=Vibrio fortis TaxID=212667 RepID=A0A5N3S8T1_9VIBR|nr:hypothetical protein [Vibrio fortis]KAB0302263.1 hypothetical protein F2Z80_14520 [Vibrio fortis]